VEHRPAWEALDKDISFMRHDNAARDRQSQASAICFGGQEWLKNVFNQVFRNTWS